MVLFSGEPWLMHTQVLAIVNAFPNIDACVLSQVWHFVTP